MNATIATNIIPIIRLSQDILIDSIEVWHEDKDIFDKVNLLKRLMIVSSHYSYLITFYIIAFKFFNSSTTDSIFSIWLSIHFPCLVIHSSCFSATEANF